MVSVNFAHTTKTLNNINEKRNEITSIRRGDTHRLDSIA